MTKGWIFGLKKNGRKNQHKIALVKYNIKNDGSQTLIVIQVYAPTTIAEEKKIKEFYNILGGLINEQKINMKNHIVLMGALNSLIGKRQKKEDEVMGPYNYGKRNKRIRFCMENELKIINTLFKKRKERCWIWVTPNQEYRNQI